MPGSNIFVRENTGLERWKTLVLLSQYLILEYSVGVFSPVPSFNVVLKKVGCTP